MTTPAPLPLPVPATVPKPDESLGTDLHRKIREDEKHFREQHDAAKRDFELRQTEEKKLFSATLEGKGFWERNRMKRQFRETQNLKRKEFDAEQDKKRRTYEWRYP